MVYCMCLQEFTEKKLAFMITFHYQIHIPFAKILLFSKQHETKTNSVNSNLK